MKKSMILPKILKYVKNLISPKTQTTLNLGIIFYL